MGINNMIIPYITNDAMVKFIREEKIKVRDGKYSSALLIEAIENYSNISGDKKSKVINKINEWIFQGRKKILYRYFKDELDIKIFTLEELLSFIYSNFEINEFNIFDDFNFENEKTLTGVNYIYDTSLKYLKFDYVLKVKQKNRETEIFTDICIPAFVEVDFDKEEIRGRIASKSDIYTIEEVKTEDIKLLEVVMEDTIRKLNIDVNISQVQKQALQMVLYEIHKEITDLPEEIINRVDLINGEIDNFINESISKLELVDDENTREELQRGIKNTLLKNIIASYDDKNIFQEGKYAISTGLNLSGKSKSLVEYHAPACEPVQSNPEYQNIRNIFVDSNKIRKDVIFWNSSAWLGYKIRMKIYSHIKGYIQVCFEQYVYEEDIESVLSKIREFV